MSQSFEGLRQDCDTKRTCSVINSLFRRLETILHEKKELKSKRVPDLSHIPVITYMQSQNRVCTTQTHLWLKFE
jgi:hypothetical protein